MLTGDAEGVALAVARDLGLDRVRAQVRPEDKAAEVERLRAEGKVVAMALRRRHQTTPRRWRRPMVGIAMGSAPTSPWKRRG